MFCPGCRCEYRPGFDRCADCGLPLVHDLEPLHAEQLDLVQILETTDSSLLPVVCTVLEAAGIPYIVRGDESMRLFPLGAAARDVTSRLLGARLLVPRERAEEARALLESGAGPDPDPYG